MLSISHTESWFNIPPLPLKKGMTINAGENWMDCGGNVGAFTLLACSKGANVTVYEPDPYNCEMIKKNLALNGFEATIKQYALVHDDTKVLVLFIILKK
jgi:tRNA1(Val) A37 N6-methylase TrmN6